MANIFENSLAKSTWKTYGAAQRDFCESVQCTALPASEDVLIFNVAQLSRRLAHSFIHTYYMSAIRSIHVMKGLGDPFVGRLKLEQFLKGVRRLNSRPKDSRIPITPFVLRRVRAVVDLDPLNFNNSMFWAACSLGFFAFLRSGEFTVPSAQAFDSAVHLTTQDISVVDLKKPSCLVVAIKASKTDQSRVGVSLCVEKTGDLLCPVLAYLVRKGMESGPLFRFEDYSPLTRSKLVELLRSTLTRAGMNCSSYSGHSFRIGAATTAAARVGSATLPFRHGADMRVTHLNGTSVSQGINWQHYLNHYLRVHNYGPSDNDLLVLVLFVVLCVAVVSDWLVYANYCVIVSNFAYLILMACLVVVLIL